ncbi:Lanthionine synthetase C-like protein (plasmid) [Trichormus variabilis ATCC 29413]|uniref:Lanthionine synthetase C-like protein n=2 Tax=Anabaena variabilis TaxID=264691 RepID=Q3M237_TRIV2|nr:MULTISPECIES: type 2 lanthipeptide synthetase LanM family protein [Nostocaceae]ABA24949.1 Lanthionine synthetase C-like protein [Trichormus variabilis ATCC 29413]MBC1217823.1 type 2 lantipeptide synthetase LanM [Trichormus variabilis ARAD]MBC1259039.1 type 2 lantipeptide synthetase LanM [Trichormus variabilis V5]MBC1305611.1 type 2 lantipeptide synthetase LanM [Trichormus variabilis N2B]MBC1314519.1 type 2 lantipeptide synthetase LanM [Trichormus variabilis PNB]
MKKFNYEDATWYRAVSLTERIAAMSLTAPLNADLGQRRFQRWRMQSPFMNEALFVQRLAIDGLKVDDFCYLLGQTAPQIPQAWLGKLTAVFSNPEDEEIIEIQGLPDPHLGLLNAIAPCIRQGMMQLRVGVDNLQNIPIDISNIDSIFLQGLPEQLLFMLHPTLVLELNVARLQGLLTGDTAEERFSSFVQRLQTGEARLMLWQEYPVLARLIIEEIQRWVTTSLEFLQRLGDDWEEICHHFQPNNPGKLIKIQRGAGDSHHGGRSVFILEFESGWQLVYKPRSLAVDEHFQELLLWLNQQGTHPPFKTLKILNRGDYGWMEFVKAQKCTSLEEIQRFYQRQGGYLALLYVLSATDFHFENLIAVGEHPILIDLESLFHPRSHEATTTAAATLDREMIADSVLRVGLLPQLVWGNTQAAGIDLSGLGGAAGQVTPERVPQLEKIGTDTMRIVRRQVVLAGSQNRPTLNEKEVNVQAYTPAITQGFTDVYRTLLQHRQELLKILERFVADEVRVVLRPSRSYALLLRESYHPDVLRDALERDRLFDKLWVDVQNRPLLTQVIRAEHQALWQGDIPLFTTHPHSCDLWSRDTNLHLPNFFTQSGMELVHHRIQQLSERDLQRQQWFIQSALATLGINTNTDQHQVKHSASISNSQIPTPHSPLTAACIIADRLELLAHKNGELINWMGVTVTNNHQWTLAPLGTDFYEGVPGIAFFLAYLGEITQNYHYTRLAKAAIKTLQQQLIRDTDTIKFIGAFSGWGGIIYTYTHLGTLWQNPDLIADALTLVKKLPGLIVQDEQLDMIAGVAGCIASLLSLYQVFPNDLILDVALECGEHLLNQAQIMDDGIGWISPSGGKQPLTGFAHGAAGFASVLLELAQITGKQEFQTAAIKAINYERRHFSPEAGNWLDLRTPAQNQFMTAWCHGAPGIGLGRWRALKYLDDPEIHKEIAIAIHTTINQGFGDNQCLCHGDLGNLDLLLLASKIQPELTSHTSPITNQILNQIHQHNFYCGVPLAIETPGLMTGLAGIGYGCLRLDHPEKIPSILLLEPPHTNSKFKIQN